MPGLLDPIKEHGVVGGLSQLAPQMIPGGWIGQAAGARSTDGFDIHDIFGALGDFKTDLSYIVPGIGDVKGAQLAMDAWGSNTDWLTKGLSTLGILGPIATGTQAAGIVGGVGSIRRLRNLDLTNSGAGAAAGHVSDTMPVVRGHTVDDALSRLAPDMTGTTAKVSLIPTTSRTSRQLMVGITDIDQPGFNRQERMGRLRGAITGDQVVDVFVPGNKANAAQVDGFLMGLGETLLKRIPDYAASRHSKGLDTGKALSHDQVAVTAVAYETSKFDWSIRNGVLDMPASAPDVTATWKLLKNGTVVPDADIDALGLALVQFAELTGGASHPEMALNHIGFGVSRVFLNGQKSLVELAVADWDGMPYHSSTLTEGVKRFDHAIQINQAGVVVAGTDNIVTFFNKHVRPGWNAQAGPYRRSVLGLADQHPALASHPDTVNMMMLNDLERFPSNATARSGHGVEAVELFSDVRRRGIVDPLEVHWNPETGAARLVNGSGRLTAARRIGLDGVPVEITANRNLPGDRILQANGKVLTGKAQPAFRKNPTKNPHPTAMGLKVAPSVNKGIIPESVRRM